MTLVTDAFRLWHELTKTDPAADAFRLDDWTVWTMNREMEEALTLDPSHTTALLLLESFLHTYLDHRTFSVNDLLSDPDHVPSRYLERARDLYQLLDHPHLAALRTGFTARVQQAIRHYGADREDVLAVTQDRYTLALLRRDALKSFQQLSRHQFLDGPLSSDFPQYLTTVYRFWNINSLLKAAVTWPSSLSLHLVQDPDLLQSFFVFVCRNGGRLIILTDRPSQEHPLQRFMARRPDRHYARRAWRHHFPYDLMDVTIHDDETVSYREQRSLVRHGQTAAPLAHLQNLAPDQLIWAALVFDLMTEHLWSAPTNPSELAFTGEMLLHPDALLTAAQRAHLPIGAQPMLPVPAITTRTISTDHIPVEAVGAQPTRHTQWMEQRYRHRVSDDTLPLIGDHTTEFGIEPQTGALIQRPAQGNQQYEYALRAFDPTTFHTREQLEADRLFLARYNFAVHIKRCEEEEFAARRDTVIQWVHDATRARLEILLAAIGRGIFSVTRHFQFPKFGTSLAPVDPTPNILTLEPAHRHYRDDHGEIHLHGGQVSRHVARCVVSHAVAKYRAVFAPPDVAGLAALCGCPIEALPDVLQHWYAKREEPYIGNPILDRIDPMEWVAKNPWRLLSFTVHVHLSPGSLNKLKRQHGSADHAHHAD